MSKVIVIGAGMGGMSVAARLQALGHEVSILEQGPTYGGKLARYERDGHVFDLGPSLFTIPSIYRDLFDRTGKPLENYLELIAPDRAFRYQFADQTSVTLPAADPGLIAKAFGNSLTEPATNEWLNVIARGAIAWQLTRTSILESPLNGLVDLIKLAKRPADIFKIRPWQTMRSLANQELSDPRMRQVLDRYSTYTGSDPRKTPAALVTIPYVEQVFGAWHISGGITKLADAVFQRCRELGVEFQFNTEVNSIETENNQVVGIKTSADFISAQTVIANCDASLLYGRLLNHKSAKKRLKRIKKTTPSLAGYILLLGLTGRTPNLAHHNIWFPANYDQEFNDIFGKQPQPVLDPTIYACVPNDPLMQPNSESESWFILINAPRHGEVDWDDEELRDSYAELIIEKLAERGFDIRDRIKWQHILTPADLERNYFAPGGAIYGSSSNGALAAFLRPANVGSVAGLYLVGGSSHPGGGLPLVGLSARIVAQLIGKAKK